jgi:hypothetical protein
MEAAVLPETFVPIYQTSQRHILEEHDLNIRGYEKLKYYINFMNWSFGWVSSLAGRAIAQA